MKALLKPWYNRGLQRVVELSPQVIDASHVEMKKLERLKTNAMLYQRRRAGLHMITGLKTHSTEVLLFYLTFCVFF